MDGWLIEGLTALISGMTTVFAVLILISGIISLFKYIKKGEVKHPAHAEAKINAVVEKAEEKKDDRELVAVITAAIAATLNTHQDNLIVKSFRRVNH